MRGALIVEVEDFSKQQDFETILLFQISMDILSNSHSNLTLVNLQRERSLRSQKASFNPYRLASKGFPSEKIRRLFPFSRKFTLLMPVGTFYF